MTKSPQPHRAHFLSNPSSSDESSSFASNGGFARSERLGKAALPAGTYTVYRASTHSGDGFLLRDAAGDPKVVFNAQQSQPAGAHGANRLEFRRYDEKYFLARVWTAGANIGHELQPSQLERELARETTRHT
ncbi:MAG: hypothetical protein ABI882_09405 [Acidobacteriota bacterium]